MRGLNCCAMDLSGIMRLAHRTSGMPSRAPAGPPTSKPPDRAWHEEESVGQPLLLSKLSARAGVIPGYLSTWLAMLFGRVVLTRFTNSGVSIHAPSTLLFVRRMVSYEKKKKSLSF